MDLILVIDDNDAMCRTISRMLSRHGFGVITSSNGQDAVKLCAQHSPCMVITDLIMPRKEGIETIRALGAKFPMIPILAISGGGMINEQELLHLASGLGANETLAKPFTHGQLIAKVERCLGHPVPGGGTAENWSETDRAPAHVTLKT
jgi:CheY-like chemotaxis protein